MQPCAAAGLDSGGRLSVVLEPTAWPADSPTVGKAYKSLTGTATTAHWHSAARLGRMKGAYPYWSE